MKVALVVMTGIGFTLGVVLGLLLQLPTDSSLTADPAHRDIAGFRSRRSLSDSINKNKITVSVNDVLELSDYLHESNPDQPIRRVVSQQVHSDDVARYQTNSRRHNRLKQQTRDSVVPIESIVSSVEGKIARQTKQQTDGAANTGDDPQTNGRVDLPREGPRWSGHRMGSRQNSMGLGIDSGHPQRRNDDENNFQMLGLAPRPKTLTDHWGLNRDTDPPNGQRNTGDNPVRLTININKELKDNDGNINNDRAEDVKQKSVYASQKEDEAFLQNLVKGVTWTQKLESSCPPSFMVADEKSWRKRAKDLDVVKMEQGCGRMQNRLLTFRDASKACARYRLNTDQIQGEIFSYYLSKLLNISNIPPTILVQVNSISPKWRTVHLDMSLARWADNKLVVLTEYIPNLSSAFIPVEFRGESSRLEPTVQSLGTKSQSELCELVQWSDLVVLDYLTANLDRVINNMFNKQWNDQMMTNPAHNLEKFPNGALVFLDNESGMFHGYRLLDKYSNFHRSLLQSACVFRRSTAEAIKRLHESRDIDRQLHSMFVHNEAAHDHLAGIPEKNVKILQQRLDDVYEQIVKCEQRFGR